MFIFLASTGTYSWNAAGHRLVAQIAYDHMTEHAKQRCKDYNQVLNQSNKPLNLIDAAVWLDRASYYNKTLKSWHYIDMPFTVDGTPLKPPHEINAVTAIKKARSILKNKQRSDAEKGFSLRVLLHVVGDLHQPMHAVAQYSVFFPLGDQGGNRIQLAKNRIATNLHAYWDNGGGSLVNMSAELIESHWPCHPQEMILSPQNWANESHKIAVKHAYRIQMNQVPSSDYQTMVQMISEQQIALAGCRLAALLNKIV